MQAIMKKKQRNNSIDLFRYLCAVLVVIIHSSFWRQWGTFGYFLGEILTRIAVPFFFAVTLPESSTSATDRSELV